jgi:hypothetical protein
LARDEVSEIVAKSRKTIRNVSDHIVAWRRSVSGRRRSMDLCRRCWRSMME